MNRSIMKPNTRSAATVAKSPSFDTSNDDPRKPPLDSDKVISSPRKKNVPKKRTSSKKNAKVLRYLSRTSPSKNDSPITKSPNTASVNPLWKSIAPPTTDKVDKGAKLKTFVIWNHITGMCSGIGLVPENTDPRNTKGSYILKLLRDAFAAEDEPFSTYGFTVIKTLYHNDNRVMGYNDYPKAMYLSFTEMEGAPSEDDLFQVLTSFCDVMNALPNNYHKCTADREDMFLSWCPYGSTTWSHVMAWNDCVGQIMSKYGEPAGPEWFEKNKNHIYQYFPKGDMPLEIARKLGAPIDDVRSCDRTLLDDNDVSEVEDDEMNKEQELSALTDEEEDEEMEEEEKNDDEEEDEIGHVDTVESDEEG